MKMNCKQNELKLQCSCNLDGVKLIACKLNHANCKQTEEITFVTVLAALVQFMKSNNFINNVG